MLDFHGYPVSSLFVVRPHGEQTLKSGKKALGVSPQSASAYADWVVDPNTALRMAPNELVSQALLPLRCAGQTTALNVIITQLLPVNGNAGSESFTADLCGELKAQLASRTEQFTKFLAWRQQAPESVIVPPALVMPTGSVFDASPTPTAVDALYHRLLDTLPDELVSVPLVLHCMFEQIEFHSELQNELVTLAEHQLNLQRASLAESSDGADVAPAPLAAADGYVIHACMCFFFVLLMSLLVFKALAFRTWCIVQFVAAVVCVVVVWSTCSAKCYWRHCPRLN